MASAALAALPKMPKGRGPEAVTPLARPFELSRVRLGPGPFRDAQDVNRRFLMARDPDRLLHMFRVTAGLPSSAEPLGGWEAPANELRGHYTGHYLSACALMGAGTGDADIRARGDYLVGELAKCQDALGNGYLAAFPEEFFDRLRAGRPVWAPFYTLHKIMAGLLDQATLAGNDQALRVVRRMAGWVGGWCQPLGEEAMARVLEREYGGMNEVLYNLAAVTGQDWYMGLAHRFDHERFFAPLAAGRDELKGLHVNTNIPKVIGAARRWELTGEARYHAVADYFWREVTGHRAYCTGGTSNGEGWETDPGIIAGALSGYTQEDCTTYNMLKLTRHLFQWTADAAVADYYERALFNGQLGVQHPADGSKLYYVPLATGFWKLFGTSDHDYWCCTGTMSETFSKLGDSIYFHDDDGVWVNQFIASEVDWPERGVHLVQETGFPEQGASALTVRAQRPVRMALRVRVPYWAQGGSARLNGRPLEGFASPSSYFVVDREWRTGDRLEVTLPLRLHADVTPDDPATQAVMYGPLVLVGKLGMDGLTPQNLRAVPTPPREVPAYPDLPSITPPGFRAPAPDPASWVRPVAGRPLTFETYGQAASLTLVPFYRLFDERYGVYWKVTGA